MDKLKMELMRAAVTLEGVLSGTYALELFAEVERLTALCDGYRGEVAALKIKCEERRNMLEDVVNELNLSDGMIEQHGPMGTAPATLVRLVLEQKDRHCTMLTSGMVPIGAMSALANSDKEAARLTGIVTALEEGCHSCQHPKRVEELTCQKNALQQVVAERDAEIEQLTRDRDEADKCNLWAQENMARDRAALTRARAEGMEESARIAETLYKPSIAAAIREACRLAEQANRGEK